MLLPLLALLCTRLSPTDIDLVRPLILELILLLLVLPDLLLPGANLRLCIAIDIECLLGVEVSAGVDPDIFGLK
jgi:hypothetical protein